LNLVWSQFFWIIGHPPNGFRGEVMFLKME
jgi:hypothetical protein